MKNTNIQAAGAKSAVFLTGFAAGLLNGVFGSGGGIALVAGMEKSGVPAARRHATSVAVVLVLSVFSCAAFYLRRSLNFSDVLSFLPAGLLGAALGALKLRNVAGAKLRVVFKVITAAGGAVSLLGLPPLHLDENFLIHHAAAIFAGAAARTPLK